MEHDDLVHAVQELRPEDRLTSPMMLSFMSSYVFSELAELPKPSERCRLILRTGVTGHDDDGIFEVHHPALTVGKPAVLENLQKRVEHVRMGLFHLVEQNHGVGLAAHALGQLAALLVAHIARRRADQPRNGVLFHIFGHVDANQTVLVPEQRLAQRLAQLGLAHARGAQEDERADGPMGSFSPARARRTARETALTASS